MDLKDERDLNCTPTSWLTRIHFTQISLTQLFKRNPTHYETESPSLHAYRNFWLTRLFPRPKSCFNQGVGVYSDTSIKNIDILPNRQYIANTANSAQEQYS